MEERTPDCETGAAFDLANAGYRPMPDPDKKEEQASLGGDSISLRAAAEQRSDAPTEPTIREYQDRDGKRVPANEAITLARASRDYSDAQAAERLISESQTSDALAARVDALRAEALAHDPDAAEFYGFELSDDNAGQDEEAPETAASRADGERSAKQLAPEVEKALQHPQIRQAIEEQLGEVEKARQEYLGGLSAATQIAQVSFLSQFPELAGMASEQLPAALEQMSQQDPAKFARVQELVAAGQQLIAQQQQESLRQAEITRRDFQSYAHAEDARLETLLKGEPRETQRAVALEIAASARASGIDTGELIRLFNSEPLMRNAVFQRMMYDAGKYRLMMKARNAAVAKPVPPVQRPGTAQNRAEREHAELRTLSTRLSNSGDIRDAVALYHARKSGRR
ncbi:hypothetical protein ES703_06664 [subsurface metagenome]